VRHYSKDVIPIGRFAKFKIDGHYAFMLTVYLGFVLYAFISERPPEVFHGFINIVTSSSVLMTDYIDIGGVGATLLNAAIVGSASVLMLMLLGIKPNGAIIMAIWLTTGFAFFGKNVFNMIPLTFGVWLFSKYNKEPFVDYSLAALLVATVAPTVSEISFLGIFSSRLVEILLGVLLGFFIGFLFPAMSASTVRVHGGYNLYNMGFAGGLICTVIFAVLRGFGVNIETAEYVSAGNNLVLSIGLFLISGVLLCYGVFHGAVRENLKNFFPILKRSGRLVSDFHYEHGNSVYINMGTLCAFSTVLTLALGAELNGPIIAGIFTVMGFGAFGKHIRNITPVMLGAVIAIVVSGGNLSSPESMIVILFSTGLAPIAGQFGIVWGAIAGFIHVHIAAHTAYLSGGMNLYANGFAAGFVTMFMLPMVTTFKKDVHK
jgi:hypothetical protein